MRKVKLQMQVSLDGFVAGPSGEMDWMVWNWDEKLKSYVSDITFSIDTILLGRKLAEGFIPIWAERATDANADDFARKMNDTPKIVFSKSIDRKGWDNAIVESDPAATIAELKKQVGQDIMVYGGGAFISSLIDQQLIDEYHLFINPVILGNGMPIYAALQQVQKLTLLNSLTSECGIVVLSYAPIRS